MDVETLSLASAGSRWNRWISLSSSLSRLVWPVVTKISDVPDMVSDGKAQPDAAFPRIRRLAASGHWQEGEVAATALVEIGKKQPAAVTAEMLRWSSDPGPNIRRGSGEGLRGLVRVSPEPVAPVLAALRGDPSAYVRKSVTNLLRDASKKHPAFVLGLCRQWARSADRQTCWVIREGFKKLRDSEPAQVEALLSSLPAD
jgi:3-methyladenine DNA glycosylase AlkC